MGSSWSAVNTGLTNLYVDALAIDSTTLYAGTGGSGVFAMTNADTCLGTGTSRIRGRITRAGGRRGVPGIPLTLDGPGECTNLVTTGARGFFVFSTLGNGDYTLTPSQAGCTFSPPSQDVMLAGQNARVHFVATCP